MVRLVKFLRVIFWMIWFFIRGWIIKVITKDPIKQRKRLSHNTTYISRKMLSAFQIKVRLINPEYLQILNTENHLIVANHVSYTDILVLSACHHFTFITSVDMAKTPLLGDITRTGGSLFTNRKKHTSLPQEINNFAAALKQGFDLVLFPEGTSNNGETIHEFRKSLFQTSIIAQKPILPICVKYHTIDDKPIRTQAQRDLVCWYGDMSFVPHFWKLLAHKIEVDVTVLKPIPFDPAIKRQELTELVYNQLLSIYQS